MRMRHRSTHYSQSPLQLPDVHLLGIRTLLHLHLPHGTYRGRRRVRARARGGLEDIETDDRKIDLIVTH